MDIHDKYEKAYKERPHVVIPENGQVFDLL